MWARVGSIVLAAACVSSPAVGQRAAGERHHDGFYLQLGLGGSTIRDSYDMSGGGLLFGEGSGTVTGFGTAQHLAIGGALAPGFILAGAVVVDVARTTSVELDGAKVNPDEGYALLTLGPMVDYYFDPDAGFHALAGFGWGLTSGVQPEGIDGGSASGYGVFVGVGNEWWISSEWGIGALLRVQYVSAREAPVVLLTDDLVIDHSALGIALMFSATYN
jgi:hypothetical protein